MAPSTGITIIATLSVILVLMAFGFLVAIIKLRRSNQGDSVASRLMSLFYEFSSEENDERDIDIAAWYVVARRQKPHVIKGLSPKTKASIRSIRSDQ